MATLCFKHFWDCAVNQLEASKAFFLAKHAGWLLHLPPFDKEKNGQCQWFITVRHASTSAFMFPLERWGSFFSYLYPHCACFSTELFIVSRGSFFIFKLVRERLSGSCLVSQRILQQSRVSWGVAVNRNIQAAWLSHRINRRRRRRRRTEEEEDGPRFGFAALPTQQRYRRTTCLLSVNKVADSKSVSGFPWNSPHVKMAVYQAMGRTSCIEMVLMERLFMHLLISWFFYCKGSKESSKLKF